MRLWYLVCFTKDETFEKAKSWCSLHCFTTAWESNMKRKEIKFQHRTDAEKMMREIP